MSKLWGPYQSYSSDDNILTLTSSFTNLEENGLHSDNGNNYFIYSEERDLIIKFESDITISASGTNAIAIEGKGNIIIDGKGTLDISSFACAVSNFDGEGGIIIGTDTNLNCYGGTYGCFLYSGDLTNYGTITAIDVETGIHILAGDLKNKGVITATGTSRGITIGTGTLANYGTITSTGNEEQSEGICILTGNLENQGTITATGFLNGVGIETGNLTNQGIITATGYVYGIKIATGDLTNNGTATSTGIACGIYIFTGNLTNQGEIIATSTERGICIENSGNLTNKGIITATGNVKNSRGIDMMLYGSLTNYGIISAKGNAYGIHLYCGDLTNYGTVTSTGNEEESAGIYIGTGNITNQGDATAMGCYGIFLLNASLTNQGDITATGEYGIASDEGGQVINKGNIIATGTSYGIFGVGLINSNNIIAKGCSIAIATRNISNESGNFEILVSTDIDGDNCDNVTLETLKNNLATSKYVKISPKTKEEPKPTPSYHGSTIDYAQYKAILEQAQKQQAELDAKKAEEEKLEKHKELVKEAKAIIKKTEFKATSTKQTKLNGKKAVKIKWEVVGGEYDLSDFDGFDIYRSAKKNSGYTKTPFFTTTKWTYTNNKDLKEGKTYYYKVRAWKMVDGEKVYTGWSTKAWRTVK